MNMIVAERPAVAGVPEAGFSGLPPYIDPLDDDRADDDVIVTTKRAICRVALVAAEAGGRFQREEVRYDAMTWMLAPRQLFGGRTAVEACLDRDACLRGILLHGLSLGLDADPGFVDGLAEGEVEDAPVEVRAAKGNPDVKPFPFAGRGELRLFTATVLVEEGDGTVQAFHASLAESETEVADRLYHRMGDAAVGARIMEGFDSSDPLVTALVSEAISDILSLIAIEPTSSLAAGFDFNIEQRFAN